MIYIQLLRPDKLEINKLTVGINNTFYGYSIPIRKIKYTNSYIQNSVSDDITSFIYKCYTLMPYRKGRSAIRNIPYIIFDYSRNLEDTFLMLYRTVEIYYKSKGNAKSFISYSINNNYKDDKERSKDEIEILSQQIISLRNHYVHTGYYIKNNCLRIKFDENSNLKNYTENGVDFDWIYKRTKILYSIVINIIFEDILGYSDYKYGKKF